VAAVKIFRVGFTPANGFFWRAAEFQHFSTEACRVISDSHPDQVGCLVLAKSRRISIEV
jgi:hypothetical protein